MNEQYSASNYRLFFNQSCEVCTILWQHEIDNLAKTNWWMVDNKFYCPDHVPQRKEVKQ